MKLERIIAVRTSKTVYRDGNLCVKVFGDEYSLMPNTCLQADEIVYGGTGFAITVENREKDTR